MIDNNNIEIRYAEELRADSNTGMVYGTAIVFNKESVLMGGQFKEIIKPSAATEDFLKQQDIVMKFNHQPDSVLARYSPNNQRNSLKFNVDSVGVHFEFRAKKGDQYILDSINAGDLTACSFAFRVASTDGAEVWEKRDDKTYLRTVNQFEIVKDFSIVINPAYESTSVNTRKFDEFKQAEEIRMAMVAKRKELGMSMAEFYAIPREPESDSKLPIFDAEHIRNAMARFNQITDVTPEEKAKAKTKIITAAKKFGIDTENFEKENKSIVDEIEVLKEKALAFKSYYEKLLKEYLPVFNK